jgi:chromosome segregation ATPase
MIPRHMQADFHGCTAAQQGSIFPLDAASLFLQSAGPLFRPSRLTHLTLQFRYAQCRRPVVDFPGLVPVPRPQTMGFLDTFRNKALAQSRGQIVDTASTTVYLPLANNTSGQTSAPRAENPAGNLVETNEAGKIQQDVQDLQRTKLELQKSVQELARTQARLAFEVGHLRDQHRTLTDEPGTPAVPAEAFEERVRTLEQLLAETGLVEDELRRCLQASEQERRSLSTEIDRLEKELTERTRVRSVLTKQLEEMHNKTERNKIEMDQLKRFHQTIEERLEQSEAEIFVHVREKAALTEQQTSDRCETETVRQEAAAERNESAARLQKQEQEHATRLAQLIVQHEERVSCLESEMETFREAAERQFESRLHTEQEEYGARLAQLKAEYDERVASHQRDKAEEIEGLLGQISRQQVVIRRREDERQHYADQLADRTHEIGFLRERFAQSLQETEDVSKQLAERSMRMETAREEQQQGRDRERSLNDELALKTRALEEGAVQAQESRLERNRLQTDLDASRREVEGFKKLILLKDEKLECVHQLLVHTRDAIDALK